MYPLAFVLGIIPATLLLAAAVVARVVSRRRVRSPGPRFAPLEGSDLLADGILWDADRRAVGAALIDLAVQHKIRVLAPEEEASRRAPIGVEVVAGARFTAQEIALLEALFGPDHTPGRVRRFSKDRRALSGRLRTLLASAEDRLATGGLIARRRRTWPVVLLWVLACAGLASTAFFALGAFVNAETVPGVLLLVSAAAVVAAMVLVPRPWRRFTVAADAVRGHLAGLHEYIALAEKEPLRFGQSVEGALLRGDVSASAREERLQRYLLNERLLPYAVLFGEEKSWTRQLRLDGQELSRLDGIDDLLAGGEALLIAIELAGGAVQLVAAVGDLADATGGVVDGVGAFLDILG